MANVMRQLNLEATRVLLVLVDKVANGSNHVEISSKTMDLSVCVEIQFEQDKFKMVSIVQKKIGKNEKLYEIEIIFLLESGHRAFLCMDPNCNAEVSIKNAEQRLLKIQKKLL